MATIDNKQQVTAQRQEIQNGLRSKRQQLLARVRYGSKALSPNQEPSEQIPVQLADRPQNPASSVSASGNVRGFGNWWTDFWNGLGNR